MVFLVFSLIDYLNTRECVGMKCLCNMYPG